MVERKKHPGGTERQPWWNERETKAERIKNS